MQQALQVADKARFSAPPNPWVGCVIVKNDQIIGRGHTQQPGQAHAEICALQEAQQQAQGATMYVTLEPCSHYGRTPPCVNAIIKAGIAKVFVAQQDPDVNVKGQGIAQLKSAGIEIDVGVCAKEAALSLAPYLYQRQTGLPYTIFKAAMSIDGRTAAQDGSSKWITSIEARQDAHVQRAHSQAIIVGAGTALQDLPALTVRHDAINLTKQPLRVLLDAKGKVEAQGPLFNSQLAPTLVFTTDACSLERKGQWEAQGAEVIIVPASAEGVDLLTTWKILGKRGILQALVEGGSYLQSQLLKAQLINCLSLYIGPIALGASGLPLLTQNVASIEQAPRFSLQLVKQIGECVRLDYEINKSKLFK
jgi:diaminohydroxyphosphoribosylaminopyrimidine deaminase/5-amino-6-(5-phosphoribosylamino)uracil reductase